MLNQQKKIIMFFFSYPGGVHLSVLKESLEIFIQKQVMVTILELLILGRGEL